MADLCEICGYEFDSNRKRGRASSSGSSSSSSSSSDSSSASLCCGKCAFVMEFPEDIWMYLLSFCNPRKHILARMVTDLIRCLAVPYEAIRWDITLHRQLGKLNLNNFVFGRDTATSIFFEIGFCREWKNVDKSAKHLVHSKGRNESFGSSPYGKPTSWQLPMRKN